MRTAFVETLCELAERDDRIWLLCGDLGYSVLERFAERFPKRYVNVGVAEQNMTGVAAGLAMCGKLAFTYSIANFPTLRCLEQIRNDICYHNANVKIVAVGGGLAYGAAGYTHFGVEDFAVMRALPNMTVLAPGDPVEAHLATREITERVGPCYLRLGKTGEPFVHQTDPDFKIGKAILIREGTDATLVSTGGVLKKVVEAAELLTAAGISARVLSMPTVHPLDEEAVRLAARETRLICVIEEHHRTGGLSDSVARCVVGETDRCLLRFCTLDTARILEETQTGTQDYLLDRFGLSGPKICEQVARALDEKKA